MGRAKSQSAKNGDGFHTFRSPKKALAKLTRIFQRTPGSTDSGAKIIYLGLDTPLEDIIETANKFEPKLLCLSISASENLLDPEDCLLSIRTKSKNTVKMITGGKGAPDNLPSIQKMENFNSFNQWLKNFEEQLATAV